MNTILEAFAEDNLCITPAVYEGSPEYRKAIDTMFKTAETLGKKLNDDEKELFDLYQDAKDEVSHLYQTEKFIRGFRVAVHMLFEVFAAGTTDLIIDQNKELMAELIRGKEDLLK